LRDNYQVRKDRISMAISARNQLTGRITDIQVGEVMAHVSVRVGKNVIESVITRRSAEQLNLKKGDTVTAIIKSTEVMLMKD
jgi:molybdopterin-binding protein